MSILRCLELLPRHHGSAGVGSDALRAANPGLVYAAGTGFGSTGPHRDYLAMDVTVQAMTGMVAITGNDGEPPLKAGPALCDILGLSASEVRGLADEGAI